MAELIYSPNPASIARFLRHIQAAGVPDKLTVRYLESVGFKSKNDRYVIGILKSLGFVDSNGTPQRRWREYRDKSRNKVVLGVAVQEAYADLYATYPDAHDKDTEALRNFFSARSSVADSTLRLAVATFKALVGEATFDGDEARPRKSQAEPPAVPEVPQTPDAGLSSAQRSSGSPSVNINIELHLPETDNPDVYNNLFAAMRKHLLD